MSVGEVRATLSRGGYSPVRQTYIGQLWQKDEDRLAIISGFRVLVCCYGMWRSFSFKDAVFLGTGGMEKVARMLLNGDGVEDSAQYSLWILSDNWGRKSRGTDK